MHLTSHTRAGAVLAFLILSALHAAGAVPRADTLRVANARILVGFDAERGALLELTDVATGRSFTSPDGASGGDLWLLDLPPGGAKGAVSPTDAGTFRTEPDAASGALRLVWSDFALDAAPGLRVAVTVAPRGAEPTTEWRIALSGLGTLGVEQVRFPRILGIPPLGPGEELAVPQWMGQRTRDPRAQLAGRDGAGARREWAYPGAMAMQMMALYRPDRAGLYLATDDTLAFRKVFALWGDGTGPVSYEVVQALSDPASPRDAWEPAYASVVGTFQGDWLTAVERYRAWGTRQRWARESRLRQGLVPDWLVDTGMWVWNRGRSPGVLGPAVALRDALGLPVSVFWHWWHHGPYDTSFPDYLPPREGAQAFTDAVREAQASDVRMMVYMNQRLWCTGTPSWSAEGAARWAVKGRDGRVHEEVYNIFDPQPCAPMDVTTEFWRAKYAGIADTVLNEYGVNGIYMDQAVLSLVCWDPTHGHPVGGGNYWMGGFEALAGDIRRRAQSGPELLLAGEGAGEAWLPSLDVMLTLQVSQERYSNPASGWEPIPMFQAAYHAYGITYGSYSSLTMPPYDDLWPDSTAPAEPLELLDPAFQRQFYLEQARSFVWGLQPTIANFLPGHLDDRARETAYMMRLARVRARALDWLLHGTFLRPPALDVPDVDVRLSRVSIYAAQRSGPQVSEGRYPAAMAGAWRAPDGRVAVAVASILDEPSSVGFTFDAAAYGRAAPGRIHLIDEGGRADFGAYGPGPTPVRLELPAGGAAVLEFRPSPPPVRTGARVLVEGGFEALAGKRVGLIANQTSMVGERHLADVLHEDPRVDLRALFAPEHGIRGTADAGAAVATETDPATGLVVHSLHGAVRKPTEAMLSDLDVLVFDLQDVGTRFYTYISTLGLAMQAAAEAGIAFVVLDRPNPLGGSVVEGFRLEPEHRSFIGMYAMPATHGMTVGEVARMLKGVPMLDGLASLELVVVEMDGWHRDMLWPETGLPWIPPSPNLPDFETAVIYPGACFFGSVEGNEGRGTERPFIQVGTPWADGEALAAELNARGLPGLRFEAVTYTPRSIPGMSTDPRLEGREVHGIRHVVTDAAAVRPVAAGVHALHAFYHQAPDSLLASFFVEAPFLRVTGTRKLHRMIVEGRTPEEIVAAWRPDVDAFLASRAPYLLYD